MEIGRSFEKHVKLSREAIVHFADEVGDSNPLHHDDAFAAATRYGGLIASGVHPVALLMAYCGSLANELLPGVGVEFTFRLKGPVRPDRRLTLRWEISAVEPKPKIEGYLVSLRGAVLDEDGTELVSADGKTLLSPKI